VYLCERAVQQDCQVIDLFYIKKPTCNSQLEKMWKRVLNITPLAQPLETANRMLPGGRCHYIPWRANQDRDIKGLLANTKPQLTFTAKEEDFGQRELRKMGIASGDLFICFHARSQAYLETVFPEYNWDYHSYRNSSIEQYFPAIQQLTKEGYVAIRMGSHLKQPLNTSNPKVVDYATHGRTDFLDIYLSAKCHFFICDTAGLNAVPEIFRRPLVMANFIPLEHVRAWIKNCLFIPKKLWLTDEHRFLTFKKLFASGVGHFLKTEDYQKMHIEVIENTSDEIMAVATEMHERLAGQWQETTEDIELQKRFWKLFQPNELNRVIHARIGADFLRNNKVLLTG